MDQQDLKRNISVLLWVGGLFGLGFGIYDLALPLYLKSRGFDALQGSVVFAVPAAISVILHIWAGRLSDRVGRKRFYSLSLLGSAVVSFVTPAVPYLAPQILLKSLRDACVQVRAALHRVFLYEAAKSRFINLVGRTEGVQVFFQSIGYVVVGYGLSGVLPAAWSGPGDGEGYLPVLILGGVLFLAAFAVFSRGLREEFTPGPSEKSSFLRELLSLKLDSRLYVLMAGMFIFSVGIGVCHSYIMYHFWQDKFGVSRMGVGWIMALHRLSFAVPLFFAGGIVRGMLYTHRRLAMVLLLCVEGVSIAAAGMISVFWLALGVWLIHDLFGAGIWMPIRDSLLQRYCRGRVRGTDTAKATALSQAGAVFGTMLGGWCYMPSTGEALRRAVPWIGSGGACYGLPFVVGGLTMLVAAAVLVVLLLIDPEERGEAGESPAAP